MGRIDMEDERGKERLKHAKDKLECANCRNQTFVLNQVSDFPYFDAICSKCGSVYIRR